MLRPGPAQPNETTANGNFSGVSGAWEGRMVITFGECDGARAAAWRSFSIDGSGLRPVRILIRYLIDDALDDDHLHMDVPGHIGQELGNVVADGRCQEGDSIAIGGGSGIGFAARNVEVGNLIVDPEADQVGV